MNTTCVERTIQIGVFEHDDRVLAAELEMHTLKCFGALAHDMAACRRLTNETPLP